MVGVDAAPLPQRVARTVAESAAAERVADAQSFVYRPVLDWARRSPFHTAALGHSVHPMLTDVTLGCWTGATLLDVLGGTSSRRAATLLAGAGLLAAVPTAVAGAADWADMTGEQRRLGAVHALGTDIATSLFLASLVARRQGRYAAARRRGLAAHLVMLFAGFLGAHLALNRGTARRAQPRPPTSASLVE